MSRQVVVLNIWISLQLDRLTERRKTVAEHEAKIHSLIFHTLDKQTAAKIEQNTKLQVKSQPPFYTDILINETNVQITHLFTHCFLCRCWSESIKRFWPPTSSSGWSRLRNGTSWTSSWTTGWKGKKKQLVLIVWQITLFVFSNDSFVYQSADREEEKHHHNTLHSAE